MVSIGLPPGIPAQILAMLATVDPTVDVYTGNSDQTLRRLTVDAVVPVDRALADRLGGITGVHIVLTLELDALNQPQAITAPSGAQPFSALEAKLRSILPGLGGMHGLPPLGPILGSSSSK